MLENGTFQITQIHTVILVLFLLFLLIQGCDYYGFTEGVYSFAGIGTMVLMTVEKFLCIWNPSNKLKFGETIILREFQNSQSFCWKVC